MSDTTGRIFLISPASCAGKRAGLLLSETGASECAARLRSPAGASLGEVFSFMSGLYFRGKLSYASAFARPPSGLAGVYVIVPGRGLLSPDTRIVLDDLRSIARVPVDLAEPRYTNPLISDAAQIAGALGAGGQSVLLGSVATEKYVGPLRQVFGRRLYIPEEFVGRGDMSRGGLMLRCVDAGRELTYVPADGVARRGRRPPRLTPRSASGPG
jgi:hypothetical protein